MGSALLNLDAPIYLAHIHICVARHSGLGSDQLCRWQEPHCEAVCAAQMQECCDAAMASCEQVCDRVRVAAVRERCESARLYDLSMCGLATRCREVDVCVGGDRRAWRVGIKSEGNGASSP